MLNCFTLRRRLGCRSLRGTSAIAERILSKACRSIRFPSGFARVSLNFLHIAFYTCCWLVWVVKLNFGVALETCGVWLEVGRLTILRFFQNLEGEKLTGVAGSSVTASVMSCVSSILVLPSLVVQRKRSPRYSLKSCLTQRVRLPHLHAVDVGPPQGKACTGCLIRNHYILYRVSLCWFSRLFNAYYFDLEVKQFVQW